MPSPDPARDLAAHLKAECIAIRASRLQRLIARRFAEALRPHGITIAQMEVLAGLLLAGSPLKPTVLADALAVERSTLSRNLALMEASGWLAAGTTSASGRAMTVSITAAGRKKLTGARTAWRAAQRAVVEALGADAAHVLDRLVARMEAAPATP